MTKITWTGRRSAGGLLYTAYTDSGDVTVDGKYTGYVLKLPDGRFDARTPGITLGVFATEELAVRHVAKTAETGSDWNAFNAWSREQVA